MTIVEIEPCADRCGDCDPCWHADYEQQRIAREREAIAAGRANRCPVCHLVSYDPIDVREGYCGNLCRDWTGLGPREPAPEISENDPHVFTLVGSVLASDSARPPGRDTFQVTQLNQILAVEKTIKGDTEKKLTTLYHGLQKPALLSGITRSYRPLVEGDVVLPSESTLVQVKVDEALREVALTLSRLFDVTATKDWTNCNARADVIVDDQILLPAVPVTYLLFLEKQLVNVETFIRKLPTLDPAEKWEYDQVTDTWQTPVVDTARTKKTPRNHVKAEATDRHPAQVEMYTEDVVVGFWSTVKFSGALPARRVNELLDRVTALAAGVKMAQAKANTIPIENTQVGTVIFGYLFR